MEDYKFIGLDSALIDRIYFSSEAEKSEYLDLVKNTLGLLSINVGDIRLEVINKIAASDIDVPFFREILAFSDGIQYSRQSQNANYYTNCQLCEYNLRRKSEEGVIDYSEEEKLFNVIMLSEFAGYAKLNLLFKMGEAFARLQSWEKADAYFNTIRITSLEISTVTIAGFYRSIAEVYLDCGRSDTALTWLKEGLVLNPKLGVKKMIKQLEVN